MSFTHRETILAAMFTTLTAIGAFIKIPIPYVPFTLQFFFVLLAGALLGSRVGLFSQLAYIFIGLIGIPVFTLGGGPSYVLQPTFGYLVGFAAAAYVVGLLTEKKPPGFASYLWANLAGLSVTYFFGVLHLFLIVNYVIDKTLLFTQAVWLGAIICSPGDILISVIAASVSVKLYKAIPNLSKKESTIN